MVQPAHLDLYNDTAYQQWRQNKLSNYGINESPKITEIGNYSRLEANEKSCMQQEISHRNFAIYRTVNYPLSQEVVPKAIANQLGLLNSDQHLGGNQIGLSKIRVTQKNNIGEYIPYTNRAINWHTDGYYNTQELNIHSMILHCEKSALQGGDNAFIDHELIYILLRDENPDYIDILSHQDSMTIPENCHNNVVIRPTQTGPVFSFFPWGLHMRFTARTRSIFWRKDNLTKRAVEKIREIYSEDSIYKIHYRLQPGEGVVTNNVLHMRTEFHDAKDPNQSRLMYRIRFYQPVLVSKEILT